MKKKLLIITYGLLAIFGAAQTSTTVWTQTANPALLSVNGLAFTKDGNKIISGTDCHPARIRIYNTLNGDIGWDYTVGNSFMCIMGVGFSSNGNYFAGVEEMGNILVFDNTQSQPVLTNTIAMGTMFAFSIDFSPNNRKLLVGGASGKLQTYLVSDGSVDLNLNAHGSWVTAVNYSPDNTKIASGGSDAKIKIWDTIGTLLQTLNSHSGNITSLKFSKDNQKLLSVSLDDKIKIWDVSTGNLLSTISPNGGDILGIDVSSDNNYFVTVSADKQIRIYDLSTLSLLVSFGGTTSGIPRCVAWSPSDLSKIVVGYSGSTVILYDVAIDPVGINNYKDNIISLITYPNPFNKGINVNWLSNSISEIEITDIQGKKVYHMEKLNGRNGITIEGTVFDTYGTYFLCYKTITGKRMVKKIIKE